MQLVPVFPGSRRSSLVRMKVAAAILLLLLGLPICSRAYSVLAHEAIIDSAWDDAIKPLLLKRFPSASPEDLKQAHSYAYGGAIIADAGYYPFGNKFFSDLIHYVRSADFVEALLRDSQDVNEYAFALGCASALRCGQQWPPARGEPCGSDSLSEAPAEIRKPSDVRSKPRRAPQNRIRV